MGSSNIVWNTTLHDDSDAHIPDYEIHHQGCANNSGIFMTGETIPSLPITQYPENYDTELSTNLRGNYHTEAVNAQSQGQMSLHSENYPFFGNDHNITNSMSALMGSQYPSTHEAFSNYMFNDLNHPNNLNNAAGSRETVLGSNYTGIGQEMSLSHPQTPLSLNETENIPCESNSRNKRQLPYAQLLYQALSEAKDNSMALRDIYTWFENNTDKTRNKETRGWQNSIRHNLSMNAVSFLVLALMVVK